MRTIDFWIHVAIWILSDPSMTIIQRTSAAPAVDTSSGDWSAGKLRAAAEESMMSGDTGAAVEYLHRAIDLEPSNALNHYRLYRLYHRKRQFDNAEKYISLAAEIDPMNYQTMKAKALLTSGHCEEAINEYHVLITKNIRDRNELNEDPDYIKASRCIQYKEAAENAFEEKDYANAVAYYDELQQNYLPGNIDIVWPKAVSMFHMEDYYGVIREMGRLLKHQPQNIDAYRLRGDAYHRLGEHDQAIAHYREGLKLDPEHKECKMGHKHLKSLEKKKKNGQNAFDKKEYDKAIEIWTAATNIDPTHYAFNRPLQLQIVLAYSRAGKHNEAIALAESHIDVEKTLEGLWALGEAYQSADQFEQAVRIYQDAVENATEDKKQLAQEKLQNAQVALKQSKEKNYYKILNLQRSATKKEIKKAYRELALKWHPDKNLGDNQEKAEKMFQDISEAYEILSDDELKGKYDRGEQVYENQGGGGGQQHHNPHQFFQQHFQQGGGGGGGGGGQRYHFQFG